jgi:molecular chaperone GrpE
MLPSDSLVSEPTPHAPAPQPSGEPAWDPEPSSTRAAERDAAPWAPGAREAPAPEVGSTPVTTPVTMPVTMIDRQAALRALRNLEATEARLERNARREAEDARGKLVQELLPVLDNLDRTICAAHPGRDAAILEGVRLVRHQLEGVLRGYGVERIDAIGQRFDPSVHEAIGVTPVGDPARHGLIVQQAEPGYRFASRLLRPAKVSVGKLTAPVEHAHRSVWR